jgi:ferredoxin/flavodoxin---NADP+ reductase
VSGGPERLRVAIVGTGPAGFYAAEHLLNRKDVAVEVEMFDRLPTPFGLVRAGVAPDHPQTKRAARLFEWTAGRHGLRLHLNVEVGVHLSHEELLAHHHAVVYAVGATFDRALGIPGENLPGSHGAGEFVGWYNGHPDHRARRFDLSGRRAVIIGNGNVALDIARILLQPAAKLAATDIADHALSALKDSNIDEVVLVARRGRAQAAFTSPELLALGDLPDVDVVVDPPDAVDGDLNMGTSARDELPYATRLKCSILQEFGARATGSRKKRIVLKFLCAPVEIVGGGTVEGLRIVRNELVHSADGHVTVRATADTGVLQTGLVLRSIGYRGQALAGVPVDHNTGTIANIAGRVTDPSSGWPLTGVYAAGWVKRGPSGVIGTNKKCSLETVDLLLDDYAAGRLPSPMGSRHGLDVLIAWRQPAEVDITGWRTIDAFERRSGRAAGRPRVKLASVEQMLAVHGS